MNLKEAFRFQNKLQSMMADAQSILGNNGNITKVQNTYLRHKVMAEAEDEVTMEAPSTEYSENITEMAEFLLFLLDEREKLSAAIHQAKGSLPLGAGLDGEVSLNGKRQEIATLLRHMAGLRNGEVLISNGGVGYNPRTGVFDFVGGKADIAGDLVRCVGDPDRRFQEDGLRMLRALRFASVYGMTIEAATAAAIHRNKHLLKGIAAERILVELTKMLCAQGAAGVLRDFADVLAVPIPELTPMFGFPQHNPHHDKDVWDHTIAVIESITPEPVLRWAALLHDIGKPSCFSLAEDGIGHFFGHSDQSTSMAESILSRLRFDNASKEQIVRLVRYHDMPITADRKPIKRLLSKHGEDATRQLIELHKADTLGQSAICRHRIAIFEEVSQMINEILQEESCFTLKDLAVNGHDMMTLGFQGPTIGRVLQECLDAVLDEQIPNEHEALMAFAKDRQLKS